MMPNQQSSTGNLQFLKLGGSLITDKSRPSTARMEVIERLAAEIAHAFRENPGLRLVLGHGSGSFGHAAAKQYGTRAGVKKLEGWRGFAEVWFQAGALHRIVIDVLHAAGLPAISFPVSAGALTKNGIVESWDINPVKEALKNGLLPVTYGDVVFDVALGGTILSTEDIFAHIARQIRPSRILLAGLEPGVWADYPARTKIVSEITPKNIAEFAAALGDSAGTDVTGGMASKVNQMLEVVSAIEGLEAFIFSGEAAGAVQSALLGQPVGTRLHRGG